MLVYLAMIDSPQDKDKFAQIYAEYRDMMLRIARRFFSNEADAEDAVHQAFLKIIDRMDKIVQIDCHKTRSYIAIVTEHTSIDLLRAQKKHEALPLDRFAETLAEDAPIEEALSHLIDGLKPIYREVLYLRYKDEMDEKSIAELLGLSYGNVRKIIERAKKALQEKLEGEQEP